MPADPTRPPSAPGRHRRIRLSAVLLSVAVLLVACTSGSARSSGGSKVDLRTPSPAVPSFVGEWHVHGSALSITSTTAGHSVSNDGPCGAADNYGIPGLPMCQEKDEFRFRLSPDGRTLTGTVTSAVIVEATTGKARPDRPTGANPGETFTLAFAAPNLLISDPPSVGNPYLCNTQTSKADLPKCGA